eukprot:g44172.t1
MLTLLCLLVPTSQGGLSTGFCKDGSGGTCLVENITKLHTVTLGSVYEFVTVGVDGDNYTSSNRRTVSSSDMGLRVGTNSTRGNDNVLVQEEVATPFDWTARDPCCQNLDCSPGGAKSIDCGLYSCGTPCPADPGPEPPALTASAPAGKPECSHGLAHPTCMCMCSCVCAYPSGRVLWIADIHPILKAPEGCDKDAQTATDTSAHQAKSDADTRRTDQLQTADVPSVELQLSNTEADSAVVQTEEFDWTGRKPCCHNRDCSAGSPFSIDCSLYECGTPCPPDPGPDPPVMLAPVADDEGKDDECDHGMAHPTCQCMCSCVCKYESGAVRWIADTSPKLKALPASGDVSA